MFSAERFRYWLYRKITRRRLKNLHTERHFCTLSRARTMGILFECNSPQSLEQIQNYIHQLQKEGKDVHTIGYMEPKSFKGQPPDQENLLTSQDINWAYIPKSSNTIRKFIVQRFDILLNLYPNENLPLEYISTLSRAHLRVGTHKGKQFLKSFDILIEVSQEDPTIEELIKQVEHYLKPKKSKAYA